MSYDVIVVGAGGSGSPLAARLSEDPLRSVLLLEAGPAPVSDDSFPPELHKADTVQGAAPDHPNNWSFLANLTPGRPYSVARGRILGGSTAISGTYFIRAPREDFDRWSGCGASEWAWERVLPFYRKLENDQRFGPNRLHGGYGPIPVSRSDQRHPLSVAFSKGAAELGFPLETDKNGDSNPGYGPVPTNSIDGRRVNTGMAYINPARSRSNLHVRGDSYVQRVLFEGRRAVGVEVLKDGRVTTVLAGEVVLSAGAIKTPHILLLSGVGPADELACLGIPVVSDLPGVGKNFTDHPNLFVNWRTRTPLGGHLPGQSFAGVLNFTAPDSEEVGDLEIIALLKDPASLLSGSSGAMIQGEGLSHKQHDDVAFLVSLQSETSRGNVTLTSADPAVQPHIEFNYLSTDNDRRRMRQAIRLAVQLLQSQAYIHLFAELIDLDDEVLRRDEDLDRWIFANLGTALHLCGTAKFGPPHDIEAVTDQYGRVRGVQSLRVADTSLLPTAPRRGPAATAVLIGERIAHFIKTERG